MDIQTLLSDLKTLCFPTYKYKQGNCHNIVHYCSLYLKSKNIIHKKIWFYAPIRMDSNSTVSISKSDNNGLALNNKLSWGYHVALLFEINQTYQIIDLIINEDEPLNKTEWELRMGLETYKVDVVDPENYLFYPHIEGEKKINVDCIQYFKYEGFCKENHWLPSALAINETAYMFFCNEKEILAGKSELSRDYKILVGSVLNFETVIRDRGFNKKVTIQFQAIYFELIEKYRQIYLQNLNKWINSIEKW